MSQNETTIVMALVKMLPFVYTTAKYFILFQDYELGHEWASYNLVSYSAIYIFCILVLLCGIAWLRSVKMVVCIEMLWCIIHPRSKCCNSSYRFFDNIRNNICYKLSHMYYIKSRTKRSVYVVAHLSALY
jgi:hypothetical protein